MRASYLLGLAVLFLGMVVTFRSSGTASRAAGEVISTGSIMQSGGTIAARAAAESLPDDGGAQFRSENVPFISIDRNIVIGETLPEFIELRSIPKHETYRYAVVNDHRVIVDAASREIVYVVR